MTAINRRVETRVGTLAVADHGSGTPVVMWPSLFSDHRLFDHVVERLGPQWRTIRVDGPGFGRSTPPRGDVQPATYAAAVVDLLDELDVDRSFVAGCSWGGQVAAHVGVQSPNRCCGVLMMNTPLAPSMGGQRTLILGTRWLGSTAFWGSGVARSMIAEPTTRTHPERVADFVAAFRSFDRTAAATTVQTVLARSPGLADLLPRLRVLATILMGAQDRLYPPAEAMPLAQRAVGATVEVVPSCGHLAPLEAPESVVAALESLRDRAAGPADARR
jgi:pimeloyl-ACP methyl ester carboxylesterase